MAYVQIGNLKRAQRDAAIPQAWLLEPSKLPGPEVLDVSNFASTCGLLDSKEIEIIHTPAPKLVQQMISRELTSHQVTISFCKAASLAHQVVNPLTEIFFDYGLRRAKQIDEEYAQTGKVKGPFHGLPISIKDSFNLKGYDSTIGFASFALKPATHNAYLVDILEDAGAVLYCKTNIPPGMLRAESVNNTFGRSVCPYNIKCAAGGSSGGEGALVSFRGSPLGVGTDIAGSIRMPSAFCGLYGFKPTAGRIPLIGGVDPLPGEETVLPCAGPMANDVESLEMFCKAVSDAKPWIRDPTCINMPWKENIEIPEKLCIGVIEDDNFIQPTPPVTNTLKNFVNVLEKAGHTIIKLSPSPNEKLVPYLIDLYLTGGPGEYHKFFGDTGEDYPSDMNWLMDSKVMSVSDQWKLQHKRNVWKKELYDMWADTCKITPTKKPIDCILSPASVFSSPPHEKHVHMGYTAVWNVADFPASVFPVARVNEQNSKVPANFKPRNGLEKKVYANYDANEVHGAPVNLQVICHRFEDEKTLKITKLMADLVEKTKKGHLGTSKL